MSKNSVVSLTLQVKGQQASQELKRIATEQVTAVQRINTEQQKLAPIQASQINNAKKISDELRKQGQAFTTQKREVLALDTARKLGIRTEQQITTEIKKTQGAYTQLSILQRQGLVTAKDMERAYASMKSRVAALNTELGKTVSTEKQIQQIHKTGGSGGMSTLQRGASAAGAAAGGYYAVKNVTASPLEAGRNFESSIFDATTSITGGFKGMTKEQAEAANQQLMGYAKDAVRQGRGTVGGVSEAAQILSASGNYETVSDLQKPLVAIARSSFASGASEADMARLAGQAKQFGVAPDRTQAALDRMMGSGIAGGFELRDMAQFLPALLGVAKQAGFSGEQGLNAVTTHLQLARKYTGTPGEASTNIEDLYGLTGQKHFKDAIAKNIAVEAGDPTRAGKKKGSREFDLTQYLVNDSLKGIDTTTSIANLMNRQLSKNSEYNNLTAKLNQAIESKDEAQAENLRKAIELVITGEFGDIFHNKQSLSGISSIVTGMKNGDYKDIYNQSWDAEGSVDRISSIKGEKEFAQAIARQQETILAQIKIYDTVSDKLGDFQGKLVSIMQDNEGLTAATLAATGALTILAGVAGGAALGGVFTGGKSDGSLPKTKKIGPVGGSQLVKGVGLGAAVYAGTNFVTDLLDGAVEKISGYKPERRDAMEIYMESHKDQQAKDDQMIEQQRAASDSLSDIANKLNTLITATLQNKPIPFSTGNLMDDITRHVKTQSTRHGAFIPYKLDP